MGRVNLYPFFPKIFDFRANGIPVQESVDFFDTLTGPPHLGGPVWHYFLYSSILKLRLPSSVTGLSIKPFFKYLLKKASFSLTT